MTAQGGPHASLAGDLRGVVGSMHERYDDRVGATVVDLEVQRVADRFTTARVRSFVPLLVRRYAGARLCDLGVHEAPPSGRG